MSYLNEKTCKVCGQWVLHTSPHGAGPGGQPMPAHVRGKRHQAALTAQMQDVTFATCLATSVTYRIETSPNGIVSVFQVTRERGRFEDDRREWVALAWIPEPGVSGRVILRELGIESGGGRRGLSATKAAS